MTKEQLLELRKLLQMWLDSEHDMWERGAALELFGEDCTRHIKLLIDALAELIQEY